MQLVEYEWKPPDEEIEHVFEVVPCPFCSSDNDQEFLQVGSNGVMRRVTVQCLNCCARGPRYSTFRQAAEGWNNSDPCIGAKTAASSLTQVAPELAKRCANCKGEMKPIMFCHKCQM